MKSNVTPKPKKKAKRKPGRPPRGEEAVTPEVLEIIAQLFLRGVGVRAIGRKVGVDVGTVIHHLEKKLKPIWREAMVIEAEVELAKVAKLEIKAWAHFEETGDLAALQNVRWAMEYRAKVGSLYADQRLTLTHAGEIRLAGKSPDAFDQDTMGIILEGIKQRRTLQEALRGSRN